MGKFIDIGDEAVGFIAIGQFATGFIAFGQVATGVVAVGQVARGFFVIGQAAFGLVSLGMASGGLIYSVGMVGVGGRGLGLIIPMIPRLRDARKLPAQTSFERLRQGGASKGWVEAIVREAPGRQFNLEIGGVRSEVKFDARLRHALSTLDGRTILAFIEASESGLVARRLMSIPGSRLKEPRWLLIWAFQLSLLAAATFFFWFAVARPVLEALVKIFS